MRGHHHQRPCLAVHRGGKDGGAGWESQGHHHQPPYLAVHRGGKGGGAGWSSQLRGHRQTPYLGSGAVGFSQGLFAGGSCSGGRSSGLRFSPPTGQGMQGGKVCVAERCTSPAVSRAAHRGSPDASRPGDCCSQCGRTSRCCPWLQRGGGLLHGRRHFLLAQLGARWVVGGTASGHRS